MVCMGGRPRSVELPLRRMHAAIKEAFNPFFETLPVCQLRQHIAVRALYA